MGEKMLTCIACRQRLRNLDKFQPDDGLAFNTSGHYGSTYFDPMNGSYLEIAVCDRCVEQSEKAGFVNRVEAGRIALKNQEG